MTKLDQKIDRERNNDKEHKTNHDPNEYPDPFGAILLARKAGKKRKPCEDGKKKEQDRYCRDLFIERIDKEKKPRRVNDPSIARKVGSNPKRNVEKHHESKRGIQARATNRHFILILLRALRFLKKRRAIQQDLADSGVFNR